MQSARHKMAAPDYGCVVATFTRRFSIKTKQNKTIKGREINRVHLFLTQACQQGRDVSSVGVPFKFV